MRKRNWTLTPWFIIFSVIMFAMAVVSYDYSPVVFYIELGVSVLSLAVVLITSLRFTSYVKSTVKNIVGSIKGINEDYLEKFSCPVAVIGRQGDIVWCNSRFRKAMCTPSRAMASTATCSRPALTAASTRFPTWCWRTTAR